MSGKRDRTNELKVFLSDNEQYVLDEKVKTSHMRNKSEYIRHLILYGYVYDIDYNGLKEYSYQIAALGRNLNMIRERIMKTGNAYEEDLNEIKELMDKIWHTHESMLSKVPLQKLYRYLHTDYMLFQQNTYHPMINYPILFLISYRN